tara:strand:- start:434 stop:664 length:231 start_codon:yes stop_codon:yes gene_type:complete
MQKVINALAVVSFIGVAGIIGGGAYVYVQRDALIENAKSRIAEAAAEAITGALPGMVDAAVPELPTATGPVLPSMP